MSLQQKGKYFPRHNGENVYVLLLFYGLTIFLLFRMHSQSQTCFNQIEKSTDDRQTFTEIKERKKSL